LRPALSGGLPFPGTSLRSAQIAQHVKEYVENPFGLKASFTLSALAALSFSDFSPDGP